MNISPPSNRYTLSEDPHVSKKKVFPWHFATYLYSNTSEKPLHVTFQTTALQMYHFSQFAAKGQERCRTCFFFLPCYEVLQNVTGATVTFLPCPFNWLFVQSKQMAALQGRGSTRGDLPLGGFSCLQLLHLWRDHWVFSLAVETTSGCL